MEEERERVATGRREVEEEKEKIRQEQKAKRIEEKKKEAERKRKEQEAQAARVAEERRLRRLQQPVAGGSDDVVDGVGSVFNDSTSGAWSARPQTARGLNAFSANAFADKRAERDDRRRADDAIRQQRKAKRNQADNSFDGLLEDVGALLEEPTLPGVTPPAPTGAGEVER